MSYMRDASGVRLDSIQVATAARRLRPVAKRANKFVRTSGGLNVSDGISTGITTQLFHAAQVSFTGLRLVFANVYDNGGTETPGTDNITVKANIRMTGGNNFPVFFGGRRSAVIEPGATLISDPVGLHLTKGATFYSRTYVSVTSGAKYPLGILTDSAQEGVLTGDFADGSVTLSATRGWGPYAILGQPVTPLASPVILGLGDSIMAGYGDSFGTADDLGFLSRALDGKLSYLNLGISGSSVGPAVVNTGSANRFRMADHVLFDGCITLYGTNDLAGGATSAATLEASLISWWNILAVVRGMRTWAATIPPQTNSTDAWATATNQTPQNATGNTNRITVNGWLRDGAPINAGAAVAAGTNTAGTVRAGQAGHPLAGIYDFAAAVESATNSGFWKANYTTDGTHPNQTGAAAMAALIDPTVFGVLLP